MSILEPILNKLNTVSAYRSVTIGEIDKFLTSLQWKGGLIRASWHLIYDKFLVAVHKNKEILNAGQCQDNSVNKILNLTVQSRIKTASLKIILIKKERQFTF